MRVGAPREKISIMVKKALRTWRWQISMVLEAGLAAGVVPGRPASRLPGVEPGGAAKLLQTRACLWARVPMAATVAQTVQSALEFGKNLVRLGRRLQLRRREIGIADGGRAGLSESRPGAAAASLLVVPCHQPFARDPLQVGARRQ